MTTTRLLVRPVAAEVDKPIIKHVAAARHEAMTLYAGSAE